MTKTIRLRDNVNLDDVLAVIGQAADELGFTLETTGPRAVVAHDGPTRVSGNLTATRARVGIDVEPDAVRMKSQTTGAAYASSGAGLFTARIFWRSGKFTRYIRQSLFDAGLSVAP